MAYVFTIISGAASLGVLIGLISGIFFLILTALKWVTRVRASLYEEELRQQKRFLINNSYLFGGSTPDFLEARKPENGFQNALETFKKPSFGSLREDIGQNFQINAENTAQWRQQKTNLNTSEKQDPNAVTIKVREIIEEMVESMIEGPLDGTTVGQLSTHSAYLEMFTKYHNLLCRELGRLGFTLHLSVVRKNALEPDITTLRQTSLKRLIKRIVTEAMVLPNIKDILRRPKTSNPIINEDFKNKSYEDILATAILNKIIENFQNKNHKGNETSDENPKPRLRSKKIKRNEDNEDVKSDGNWSDTSRSDQLSLTIEEYIEEVTTALEVSDDEKSELLNFETTNNRRIPFPESGRTVVDAGTDDENSEPEEESTATELVTSTSSWEENWLFQKKRLRSTPNAHHPVPVPMLVPNPSEDFRALVGGVDADDLSDMSDCSDSILEDLITAEEKLTQLSQTKPESEPQNVEEENRKENSEEAHVEIKREYFSENKEEILNDEIPKENNDVTTIKNEKCEGEEVLEETIESLASPVLPDCLSQKDREESSIVEFSYQFESLSSHSPSERAAQNFTSAESEECTVRCPTAEREKKKWSNPVSLTENPYSLENIEKRVQLKKNDYFRIGTYTGESIDFPDDSSDEFSKKETLKLQFSRDYYINASKHPSGLSPTIKNQQSEEHEQVSRHSCEAFSSLGRRNVEKGQTPNLHPDIADGSAEYFTLCKPVNLFPPLQNQTISRQHFSEVFKTSNIDAPPKIRGFRKYRYGSHTVKLRPKVKETTFKRPTLEQELSDFEKKSLREDLKHTLLRAKGASPNFILNPVFKPEAGGKSSPVSPVVSKKPQFSESPGESKEESDGESESDKTEPSYRHVSGRNTSRTCKKVSRVSHESGYGSDSLDYSSDSLEYWRLTPPKTPEVVESTFVSIIRNRSNKENLFKVRKTISSLY